MSILMVVPSHGGQRSRPMTPPCRQKRTDPVRLWSRMVVMSDPAAGPTGRLLALLSLLQARRQWPGAVLAGRLEVTERTVRRDVDRLRALGYRVTAAKGPDGGYRLE